MTTTTPHLIQIGRQMPQLEAALEARYAVHRLADEGDPAAFLQAQGHRFTGLVTSAAIGVDKSVIEALPQLKVISSFGVGLDKIDAARQIAAGDRFVRRGAWESGKFPMTTRVSGKRLGIFGMGRIGSTIARRSSGFDMSVRYTNRNPVPGSPHAFEPSLIELARWSDFLVIAAAGGAATHHLVNRAVLQALGPKGFLINVARGSVIEETALVQALADGTIAGAGLDVFEDEPRVPEALRQMEQVVLLPHVASGTHETRQAMADRVIENLEAFFAGRPLVSQAN